MLSCEQALQWMEKRLDGCADEAEDALLQQHLQTCPSCRNLLASYEALQAGLLTLEEEPPEQLVQGVMARIELEEKPRRFVPKWSLICAAAAVLLLVLGRVPLRSFMGSKQANMEASSMSIATNGAAAENQPLPSIGGTAFGLPADANDADCDLDCDSDYDMAYSEDMEYVLSDEQNSVSNGLGEAKEAQTYSAVLTVYGAVDGSLLGDDEWVQTQDGLRLLCDASALEAYVQRFSERRYELIYYENPGAPALILWLEEDN